MHPVYHDEYRAWIDFHYPTLESARHSCQAATEKMVKEFTELTRVRGWVNGRPHWWCKAPDDSIVDPTALQFGDSALDYKEFREGIDQEPIGKCMSCGDFCWVSHEGATTYACSKECAMELDDYARELTAEIRRY